MEPTSALEAGTPGVPWSFARPAVPSGWGRTVLLFELVVLAEYFVAPALFPVTNYAGIWSTIGTGLFAVFVVTLALVVLRPLAPRVREALARPREKWIFHTVWIGAFVAGLFLTNLIQFPDERIGGGLLFGEQTIYTPLGAWPSLTVYVGPVDLWLTLNVEQPSMLFLLAWLSASALVLARVPRCGAIAPAVGPARGWGRRALGVLGLGSVGFVTGCPTCFPAYFALVALVAPSVATTGYLAVPLVPWIGLAGLLYVAGFALVLRTIRQATDEERVPASLARDA